MRKAAYGLCAVVFLLISLGAAHGAGTPGTLKWSYSTGSSIQSVPAIGADGMIYVGSGDSKLYALTPKGARKWVYTTGSSIDSSPAIGADGTIYVGSYDTKLYALTPKGRLKWAYTTADTILSSPAIGTDGTIYVGSLDGTLHAVSPEGDAKWTYPAGEGGIAYSSPAIGADGTIYVGSGDGVLHAVSPEGDPLWTYTAGDGIFYSSPAIGADGTIYVGSDDGMLHAVSPEGEAKWTYPAGESGIFSSPVIGKDNTIYVGSVGGTLHALNAAGDVKWTCPTGGEMGFSSPAIGADGTIYVGSGDGTLQAVSPEGEIIWTYTTEQPFWSSPVIGTDNTIYVGSMDGTLHAVYIASPGPADSPWPVFHHDLKHTGNAAALSLLTLAKTGAGSGAVTSNPAGIDCGGACSHSFIDGTTVTLTATASSGSIFKSWSGCASVSGATCTIVTNGAKTITAKFDIPNPLKLTVSKVKQSGGDGTVTSTPAGIDCGKTCSALYGPGTSVTLNVDVGAASTFLGWSLSTCPGIGPCTFTLDKAQTVKAIFMGPQALTVKNTPVSKGKGTVTSKPEGIDCGTTCKYGFIYKSEVSLTASADSTSNSVFSGWSGACTGTGACTVTMDKAQTVKASFTGPLTLTVKNTSVSKGKGTVTSNPAGIDCGTSCKYNFAYKSGVTLTAQAEPNSTFSGWSGACTGVDLCVVTMDKAKTVTAKFTK